MPTYLTCPRGHRWEFASDEHSRTADLQLSCPHCGALTPLPEHAGALDQAGDPHIDLTNRVTHAAPPWKAEAEATTPPPGEHPTLTPLAPPTVSGYEVLGELGRGGMGVVYKAQHQKLKRLVALKMVLAGAHAGPKELSRFHAEAEAVARLQHSNIVQIYEVGEHDGRPFFSLEYIGGGSLAQHLKNHTLAPRDAAHLIETLADAMHYAHQHGIVHRDLKPANILLAAGAEQELGGRKKKGSSFSLGPDSTTTGLVPKITDFGLAKRLDSHMGNTQTGAVMGTASYMAPEQAGGKAKEVGPAADVWALGAILYELLVGRPPFDGETPMDTMMRVMADDPVPPSKLNARVPRDLETICLKCLEKKPHRRYASAEQLAEDLRCFLDNLPIMARRITVYGRTLKWVRRRPELALLTLIGILAAAGLVGAMVLRPHPEQQAQRRAKEVAPRAQEILHKYCYECHGLDPNNIERKLNVLDYQSLFDERRKMIVQNDPSASKLILRIVDESMPPQQHEELPRVSDEELSILKDWVRGGAPPFPDRVLSYPPAPVGEQAEVAIQVRRIFTKYCQECHRHRQADGGIKILNHDLLVAKRKVVVPGNPDKSEVYELLVTEDDERVMPPRAEKRRPSAEEIAVVRRWIELGAPPFPRKPDPDSAGSTP
ncbi:MAG: protein kinase [Gemmataceae bacterium]|nr:protein kinase [Gemmataceae bacterium]